QLKKAHLDKNRILLGMNNPEVEDYYSLLRTQLLQRTKEQGHNVIMLTGALPHEGVTLTSINLAISIAKELDQYCLLVDTHLRRAVIDDYLGFKVDKGLSDYLLRDTPIYDLTVRVGLEKLSVLPAGKPITGSTEVLGSPKMFELVQEMKERYPDRYVIFNCPPLLTSPDALVFSTYVDAIILVVEARRTRRDQIMKALELLEGRNVLGTVLNKAIETIV
ncbi:MAG: capsular biosynthesis protein, partial [Desulfovibrionaceae bacterium]